MEVEGVEGGEGEGGAGGWWRWRGGVRRGGVEVEVEVEEWGWGWRGGVEGCRAGPNRNTHEERGCWQLMVVTCLFAATFSHPGLHGLATTSIIVLVMVSFATVNGSAIVVCIILYCRCPCECSSKLSGQSLWFEVCCQIKIIQLSAR